MRKKKTDVDCIKIQDSISFQRRRIAVEYSLREQSERSDCSGAKTKIPRSSWRNASLQLTLEQTND